MLSAKNVNLQKNLALPKIRLTQIFDLKIFFVKKIPINFLVISGNSHIIEPL